MANWKVFLIVLALILEIACIVGIFFHLWVAVGIFAVLTALNIRAVLILSKNF